jgi:parvulin-like peptidyl-prolyl isomerase
VHGEEITASEFRQRFEKYLAASGDRDNILVREKILNNMMNERLIVEDVHRQGLDADSMYEEKMREISGQALLDAYARRITTDTLRVTEAEMAEEFRSRNMRVSARYVYAATAEGALGLKRRLEAGESFEKLARETFRDPALASTGGSLGFFGYGDMEPALERTAFRLPIGALSDPVRMKVGYAIIRVDKRVERPLVSEYDYAKARPSLEEAILHRKTAELLAREADSISADLAPRFDEGGLAEAERAWEGGSLWSPAGAELPAVPDSVGRRPLVTTRGGTWTVGEFLAGATQMRQKDRARIRSSAAIRDAVIGLLTREVLLTRARQSGLESDVKVRDQVRNVREDYLLRRWKITILDTLGRRARWNEDSLRARFNADRSRWRIPPMVNVAEIVAAREDDAMRLARRVRAGEDFASIARRYSVRRWSAERGGELGFAARESYGPLADTLFSAAPGTIIGPQPMKGMFVILKILARKPGRARTYEESRDDIVAEILPKREETALASALSSLRNRGGIRVNMEALSLVDISVK